VTLTERLVKSAGGCTKDVVSANVCAIPEHTPPPTPAAVQSVSDSNHLGSTV